MKKINPKLLLFLCSIVTSSFCCGQGTVNNFTLVNSTFGTEIRILSGHSIIRTSDPVNIRANVTGPVGSVAFYVDDLLIRIENEPPFALAGDNNGNYLEWMKTTGFHRISAIPFPEDNGQGTAGNITTALVTVAEPAVTFTLVNADTDTDIGPLTYGHVINFASLPTNNINIRANSLMPNTESIWLDFTGTSFDRFENEAPYSVFTDLNGNYKAWCCPNVGEYSILGTPYTGNNGSGSAGGTNMIYFTIVNPPLRKAALETFPNPADNTITISIPEGSPKSAEVVITDLAGKEYFSGTMEISSNGSELNLSAFNMPPGMYVVKVSDGMETRISRLLKK